MQCSIFVNRRFEAFIGIKSVVKTRVIGSSCGLGTPGTAVLRRDQLLNIR